MSFIIPLLLSNLKKYWLYIIICSAIFFGCLFIKKSIVEKTRLQEQNAQMQAIVTGLQQTIKKNKQLINQIEFISNEKQHEINNLNDNLATANQLHDKLTKKIYANTNANNCTATTTTGSTSGTATSVQSDLLIRLSSYSKQVAEYADRLKISGDTCAQIYNEVKKVSESKN